MKTHKPNYIRNIKFEYKITLIYLVFGFLWILLSDKVLEVFVPNDSLRAEFQTFKGSFFIVVTSGFLYLLVKRHVQNLRILESQLIESESHYKALFKDNLSIILLVNPETGSIKDANQAACNYYGWSHAELCKKTIFDINISGPEHINTSMGAVVSEIQYHFEFQHRLANSEIRDVEVFTGPIRHGNKTMIYSHVHDITEQKLAEEKIRRKDQEFRKLSANVPDLLFQFTRRPDGSYFVPIASEGIRNIFGCSPEDVLDDFGPIGRVIYPEDAERVIREIEYSAEHLNYFTCEFRVQIPGRELQWIYSKSTPEKLPDGSVTWYGFNTDITQRKHAEEEIKHLNDHISTATSAAQVGIWDWDITKNQLVWDDQMYALYGLKIEDFPGAYEAWLNGVHPDDRNFSNAISQQAIRGEIKYDTEFRVVWPNRTVHWLKAAGQVFFDENNSPFRMVGVNFDITQRKKAEEALKQSEERLRDALFSTSDWVWEIDENGRYTYSSQRDVDLFDFTHDEIIGKTPFDFMPSDEANRVAAIFSKIASNKLPIKDLENWNIGKDGKLICLLTNGVPILDDEGNFKGYRGVDKNITERKYSEEVIRQSEAKLSYSQEIAKMGSWDFDLRNNKYTWSKNMYLLLGYKSFDEVSYADFINLVHPEDKVLIDFYTQEIIRTKAGASFDFRYILPDDEIIWVQSNIEPVFLNDELIELHGVNINITDKKLAEQELISAKERAEASDKLKTAFMNNISHEIRTPLNGILGFGQILSDPDIPMEDKGRYYKMLNESSDRLLSTITSIMDISVLTSGNQKVHRNEFLIENLIHEVSEKFSYRCEEKNLKLSIEKENIEKDLKICSDQNLLSKLLSSLIDNAIKFTSNGGITIGYEIKGKELQVFVKDSGIGISEKYKSQIFVNFMQVDNANTRRYEGSGIGLSISKKIIELLDGKIWFDSEQGKGTTFYFTIPIDAKNGK